MKIQSITESDKSLEFLYIMTSLDAIYIDHMHAQVKKIREKQERKAKSKK